MYQKVDEKYIPVLQWRFGRSSRGVDLRDGSHRQAQLMVYAGEVHPGRHDGPGRLAMVAPRQPTIAAPSSVPSRLIGRLHLAMARPQWLVVSVT